MMQKGLIILICLLLAVSNSFAQQQSSKEELQKRQKEVQDIQKEIDALNNTLTSIQHNKKQSLNQLAIVQRKIIMRERLINNINKDLHIIEEDMYAK